MSATSAPAPLGQDLLLKQREVALLFKCTTRTIRTWVRKGLLPQHKIGNSAFYHRKDVERLAGFTEY